MNIAPFQFRIVFSGLYRRLFGRRQYEGDAESICRQIVEECFDSKRNCYMASPRTYRDFWARDFGRSVSSLLFLGYQNEVRATYRYALGAYRRKGRFALIISPDGGVHDFPAYAPDGFAFFLYGLVHLQDERLIEAYRPFLEQELRRFVRIVVDEKTGLVRTDRRFSEAQDYAIRKASCYSTVMCHVASRAADALLLKNPLSRYDYPSLIRRHYWNGEFFYDDITKPPYISGDACITPFWADAVTDPKADFEKVLRRLDDVGITRPIPARYCAQDGANRPMIWMDRINPWQRDAVWMCLGVQYLEVLSKFNPERYLFDLRSLEVTVERLGCFPEVLSKDTLDLYRSPLYCSEDAMIWAADLLRMLKKTKGKKETRRSDYSLSHNGHHKLS
jgi:hypothetical protein